MHFTRWAQSHARSIVFLIVVLAIGVICGQVMHAGYFLVVELTAVG